jgi:hypothetical protein
MSTFDVSKLAEKIEQSKPVESQPAETVAETKADSSLPAETPIETKADAPANQGLSQKAEEKIEESKSNEEKEWWDDYEDKVVTESKNQPSQEDLLKKQLEEYEAKLKQIESIPEVLALIDAKKSGKDVNSALKELIGTDFDKLSPLELYELDLKSKGFTDDEVAELSEVFGEKSSAMQKLETLSIKERLKAEQQEKLQQYVQQAPKLEAPQTKAQENITKAETEVNNLANLVGQELYGVTLTKEIVDSVKDAIANKYVMGDAENGFDIKGSFDLHFKALYTPLIVKANVQKATAKAKEQVLNEMTRPDKGINQRAGTETVKDTDAKSVIKNIWSR